MAGNKKSCAVCQSSEQVKQCVCGGWLCAAHWAEHRAFVLSDEAIDIDDENFDRTALEALDDELAQKSAEESAEESARDFFGDY